MLEITKLTIFWTSAEKANTIYPQIKVRSHPLEVIIPEPLTLTVSLRGSREVKDTYQLIRLTGLLDAFSQFYNPISYRQGLERPRGSHERYPGCHRRPTSQAYGEPSATRAKQVLNHNYNPGRPFETFEIPVVGANPGPEVAGAQGKLRFAFVSVPSLEPGSKWIR